MATTFIAGVSLARRKLAAPVGSLTQLGTIRLGKRSEQRSPKISELVPLATMDQLEFGAWDLFEDDAYASAEHAHVLRPEHLEAVKEELRAIKPMKAVFYPEFVRRLHGTHVKRGTSKADMVEQLRDDIRGFIRERGCDRAVAVWCGSTEVYTIANGVHSSVAAFERALAASDPSISNSQMYAWALLKERVPFANGSPNLAVDFPAAWELAREFRV
ncbi:MAG TPA: inositol-3-phosphate synthase, partial [Labilithrix sp.]|nr:inositol-3-phosphate synthase [Labilithrix sp.]